MHDVAQSLCSLAGSGCTRVRCMLLLSRCAAWSRRHSHLCVSRDFEGSRLCLSTVTTAAVRVGVQRLWVLLAACQSGHGGGCGCALVHAQG